MNLINNIVENKKLTAKQADKVTLEIKEPSVISAQYLKELKKLSKSLKNDIRNILLPAIKETPTIGSNDSVFQIMSAMALLQSKYSNILAFSLPVANSVVKSVEAYNKNAFTKKSESQLGVNLESVLNQNNLGEIINLQTQKQVGLIRSIPEEFLKNIEVIVTNGVSEGLSYKEIERQIKGIKNISSVFGKLDSRIKTIARSEIGTINGTMNKQRQQSAGISIYKWSTSGDEKVRTSHKVLDNKYCSWNDATVYADTKADALAGKWKKRSSIGGVEKHPALDYNCRCTSIAVIPDFDEE